MDLTITLLLVITLFVVLGSGVWIGLTLWQIPLVSMLLLILWSLLIKPSGWAVLITLCLLLPIIGFWLGDRCYWA